MKKREILIISALSIFFTFLLIKQRYSPIDYERYTPTEFLDNKMNGNMPMIGIALIILGSFGFLYI